MLSREQKVLVVEMACGKVADPSTWTQFYCAKDANDEPCGALDKDACKWCGNGALVHSVYALGFQDDYERSLGNEISPHKPLGDINDFDGREAVLKLFADWLLKNKPN